MRILICAKQVPDTAEVHFTAQHTMERDFVAQIINHADESALELGLRLRDESAGEAVVLTMGPERSESMLREALARGADKAVHLCDRAFAGADTLVTAKCLRAAVDLLGGFDLILCGRRAADGETGQVGPMLAALLNIPCAANVVSVQCDAAGVRAEQLCESGKIRWEMPLPAVVTLCEWSYRLRLPTIQGLRRAQKESVQRLTASELGMAACGLRASPTRVTRIHARTSAARPCRKLSIEAAMEELERKGVLR